MKAWMKFSVLGLLLALAVCFKNLISGFFKQYRSKNNVYKPINFFKKNY